MVREGIGWEWLKIVKSCQNYWSEMVKIAREVVKIVRVGIIIVREKIP